MRNEYKQECNDPRKDAKGNKGGRARERTRNDAKGFNYVDEVYSGCSDRSATEFDAEVRAGRG